MPRGVYPRKPKAPMSNHIDATSEAIEGREREFSVADIAESGPPQIDTAPVDVLKKDDLDREVFMAQKLKIHLHEPQTEVEPKYCFVGVNGRQMWLERGREYEIPRAHVAVLAQAKTGRVKQTKMISPDGSQGYVETEVLMLSYPFTVLDDPAGQKGRVWLRDILSRAE